MHRLITNAKSRKESINFYIKKGKGDLCGGGSCCRLIDGTSFTAAVLLTSCNDTLHQFDPAGVGLALLATSGAERARARVCVWALFESPRV